MAFENLWNNKGPIRFVVFSIPLFIKNSDPIAFKIFNDFIYFFISLIIFLICKSKGFNNTRSIVCSLFFIYVTSYFWGLGSGYSEYYGLLFIGISLLFLNKVQNTRNIVFSGLFLSLSLLTTPALIFHSLACLIFMVLTQKQYLKTFLSFFTPMLIVLLIYKNAGIVDILLYNYTSPFEYASAFDPIIFDKFFETIVLPLNKRDMFLYGLVSLIGIFNVIIIGFELFKKTEMQFQSLIFILLILSIGYFIFGGKAFHHHLIYFISSLH